MLVKMSIFFLLFSVFSGPITGFTQFRKAPDTIINYFKTNSLYPNPPNIVHGCLVIPNGTYIGDERMAIRDTSFWPGYLNSTDTNKDL